MIFYLLTKKTEEIKKEFGKNSFKIIKPTSDFKEVEEWIMDSRHSFLSLNLPDYFIDINELNYKLAATKFHREWS